MRGYVKGDPVFLRRRRESNEPNRPAILRISRHVPRDPASEPGMKLTLDKFDRRILAILQRDNLATSQALGERVGLSASAVQRRIKRMRDARIILRDTAVLDGRALDRPLTVIVEVSVDREAKDVVESFRNRAMATAEVQQCYYVTGEADFVLIVAARSMEDYQDIARRLFLDDANVRRFRSSVVIEALKATLDIPIL